MDLVIDASWRTSHRRDPPLRSTPRPSTAGRAGYLGWALACAVDRVRAGPVRPRVGPAVQRAVEFWSRGQGHLLALCRSKELGHFGAGDARNAPCPLRRWRCQALSELRSGAIAMPAHGGSEAGWPYGCRAWSVILYVVHGTDFRKLKVRSYGTTIVHVLDVLSGSPVLDDSGSWICSRC